MLLVISLIGSWQARAEWCEPAAAQCHRAQSADCCRLGHCCCDMSARSEPASNPKPLRATQVPGRGMVRIASLPVAAVFLAGGERVDGRSNPRVGVLPSAITPPYLLTHAFLI